MKTRKIVFPGLIFILMVIKGPTTGTAKNFVVGSHLIPDVECEETSDAPTCDPAGMEEAAQSWGETSACRPMKHGETACVPAAETSGGAGLLEVPAPDPCICEKVVWQIQGINDTTAHDSEGEKVPRNVFCCSMFTATVVRERKPGCEPKGPECGNGVREGDEECEKYTWNFGGVTTTGAYCLSGEQSAFPGPALLSCVDCKCMQASCGDGLVNDMGEQCEPPNSPTPDGMFCNNDCQKMLMGHCGDGVVNAPDEKCDTGPAPVPGVCENCQWVSSECGNGILQGDEFCDTDAGCPKGTTCASNCSQCVGGDPVSCGNGRLDPGEACDPSIPQNQCPLIQICEQCKCQEPQPPTDKKQQAQLSVANASLEVDGETDVSVTFLGFVMNQWAQIFQERFAEWFGEDTAWAAEAEEKEKKEEKVTCLVAASGAVSLPPTTLTFVPGTPATVSVGKAICKDIGTGIISLKCDKGIPLQTANVKCEKFTKCGNGVVESGEQCDDGNQNDCDGCSNQCTKFVNVCGDGHLCGNEQCDDGNLTNCDGCSDECKIEPGRPSEGTPAGNYGYYDLTEGMGCTTTCTVQQEKGAGVTAEETKEVCDLAAGKFKWDGWRCVCDKCKTEMCVV